MDETLRELKDWIDAEIDKAENLWQELKERLEISLETPEMIGTQSYIHDRMKVLVIRRKALVDVLHRMAQMEVAEDHEKKGKGE